MLKTARGWRRPSAGFGLLLALSSCDRKAPAPSPERTAPTRATASTTAPPSTTYAVPEPELPPSFEVEFEGTVKGTVRGGVRYVVLISEQPCTADNLGTVPTIAIGEARTKPKGRVYATEGNVREGSQGHVCATVLDERGRAIGFGAYAKNPLVFGARGKDELELEDVHVSVAPLLPPRTLPPDRF